MSKWQEIKLIDVIQGLKQLPDNYADLVIIDPPYNIKKDFGNNKDNLTLSAYRKWAKQWIDQCLRILKPGAIAYCYGFSEILAHLSTLIDLDCQRWLIWHYKNKSVPTLNFWQRSHEAILCFWKQSKNKLKFNRDLVRVPYSQSFLKNSVGKKRSSTTCRFNKNPNYVSSYQAHQNGALPKDVIEIATLAGGKGTQERFFICKTCDRRFCSPKERRQHENHQIIIHPTQKPLALTTKLVQSVMVDEKIALNVVIPFSGSGSEAIVCQNFNHNFIGFEINPDYVELARKWLMLTKDQKPHQK